MRIAPVTRGTYAEFEALFEARGAPHYCWCTIYRSSTAHRAPKAEKKRLMHELVGNGTPIGVLAYAGKEPVGWCSVAPRQSYVKLERSRTMPRVSPAETWVVLCFFVRRERRGSGVPLALLKGAVAYARANGAEFIEGYPHDSAGTTATHRGTAALFAAAGFQQEGTRWFRKLPAKRAAKSRERVAKKSKQTPTTRE